MVYVDLGQYQKALDARNTLLEITPNRPSSILLRADIHFVLGNYAAGMADCRKVVELSPLKVRAWYALALAHLHGADNDGYRQVCAGMLERFQGSTDSHALYFTAWTCLLGPNAVTDWKQPLTVAEKLLAEDPNNCDKLNTLGGILFRASRLDEAAARLTEAEAAFKDTSNLRGSILYNWLLQAMTQYHLGNSEQAEAYYDQAMKQVAQPTPNGTTPVGWNRQLTLRLLRQEYESLTKEQ